MVRPAAVQTQDLHCWYGEVEALKAVRLEILQNEIFGIIGPANSGKTTFLRSLNRLNSRQVSYRQTGLIRVAGEDISRIDDHILRRKVGIIFAMPQVLPVSIFENVAYGPRVHGTRDRAAIQEIVETSMRRAYVWDELKDRLHTPAVRLSGGQQQRLCIARTLAVEPEVILYDEPCSGLDPISTAKVEDTMRQLKEHYTQILVTNNTKQAARVSDRCGFFLMGEVVEVNDTVAMFTSPADPRTNDYITGRFG
ncbi:MAG: phosphate ABC transporter ATP-binding protein [Phycisphaerae bacterium]|nr:phosphate ABC transporter ATP-binding protein [Phycisphaerae bacterium]